MNTDEFISLMKSRGATVFPVSDTNAITIANAGLQEMRAAMLPAFLIDVYRHCFGISLGSALIFGPKEIDRGIKYPLPSIASVNREICGNGSVGHARKRHGQHTKAFPRLRQRFR